MSKVSDFLSSKKFWTLVAALVAALAAYFTTSCSSAFSVRRSGVHVDTVEVHQKLRSNNYEKFDL